MTRPLLGTMSARGWQLTTALFAALSAVLGYFLYRPSVVHDEVARRCQAASATLDRLQSDLRRPDFDPRSSPAALLALGPEALAADLTFCGHVHDSHTLDAPLPALVMSRVQATLLDLEHRGQDAPSAREQAADSLELLRRSLAEVDRKPLLR